MSQRVFAGLVCLIIYKYVCQCFMLSFAGALGQIQVIRLACSFTATLTLILLAWSPSQPVRRDRNRVYTGLGPVSPAEV